MTGSAEACDGKKPDVNDLKNTEIVLYYDRGCNNRIKLIYPSVLENRLATSCDLMVDNVSEVGDDWRGACLKTSGELPRDWPGITRDTAYFVGYQIIGVGLLYILPESITGWTEERKDEYDLDRWAEHVRNPGKDNDAWYANWIFHPYWGAAYYIRARERNFEKFESFLYSVILSTLFEFGVEALFEHPSWQDLIITPVVGSLVGMYFETIRNRIKAKEAELRWYDKLTLIVTDPLGVANRFTDRILGIKSNVDVRPVVSIDQECSAHDYPVYKGTRNGYTLQRSKCYNGLSVNFTW